MKIRSRKASHYFPEFLQPAVRRLGLEWKRGRLACREAALNAHLRRGSGVKHLHGPVNPSMAANELVVLCRVRNGSPWLPAFIRHYRNLGAKHIVFLDNASTDETVELASSYSSGVSVFSTSLPFAPYEVVLGRWLVKRFGRECWSLVADIDELFDYPFSSRLPLESFLRYLDHHSYNAVHIQMLDMAAAEPLAELRGKHDSNMEDIYRFYDIANITKNRDKYCLRMNRTTTDEHFIQGGGIRSSIFGRNANMLSKQHLVRYEENMNLFPYDGHFVTGASLADVTGVFRHYKFIGHFYDQVKEEVRRGEYRSQVYGHFKRILEQNPGLCLFTPTAREYNGAEDLIPTGFATVSEEYQEWVHEYGCQPKVPAS